MNKFSTLTKYIISQYKGIDFDNLTKLERNILRKVSELLEQPIPEKKKVKFPTKPFGEWTVKDFEQALKAESQRKK